MRPPLPEDDLDFVLAQTAEFWSRFEGARIFMTGATGFVGSWLMEVFLRANQVLGSRIEVVALTRAPDRATAAAPHVFGSGAVNLIAGDVRSFDAAVGAIDVCIHAATDVGDPTKAADHLAVFDVCVHGTRRVLDCAVQRGATHFLLTSSGAVYGTQPPSISHMPETSMLAPNTLELRSSYGEGKRAAEWLAGAIGQQSGMSVAVARIYALLGPNLPLSGAFAAGNLIRDALSGGPIQIKGDGRPVRSYLYMADACVWLLRVLMSGRPGHAYNVGSENAISIAELADRVVREYARPLPVEILGRGDNSTHAPRYVPDTTKARTDLGLAEYTPIGPAIRKTMQWNKKAAMA